jgi:hypothetical protein
MNYKNSFYAIVVADDDVFFGVGFVKLSFLGFHM